MATTKFYLFVVTFAGAQTRDLAALGQSDRVYQIAESPQHDWAIVENEQLVATTGEQQALLARLLAALDPLPDLAIEPTSFGSDGTWITFVIQRGDQQTTYRWWASPPAGWSALGAIAQYVQQLADLPREQVAQQQRRVVGQLFERIAARDLRGMLALYHPTIIYTNPFYELQAGEVAMMWQMVWSYLPDLQIVCREQDIRNSAAHWQASYTYPPTGRQIQHHLSAEIAFADGAIIRHTDRFNVHEWAHRAYGFVGRAIGGSGLFQRWIARRARARLSASRPEMDENSRRGRQP